MNEQATQQQVALVTGANKGIGRGATEQLAALGMTVLVGARDQRRGEEAAAALRAAGTAVDGLVLDFDQLLEDGLTMLLDGVAAHHFD